MNTSCPAHYAYGENTFHSFRVEGCSKEQTPQGRETSRRAYSGTVEVNGLLIEGGGDLIATARKSSDETENIGRLQRSNTNAKIVLDPKIGGARRRLVIFTGAVDLQASSEPPTIFVVDGRPDIPLTQKEGTVKVKPSAHPAITRSDSTTGTMDLPINGGPSILGMRIRETIHDVAVNSRTDGTGGMKLKPTLSLGALAPALLGDNTSKVNVETVDGTGMKVTGLHMKIPNIAIPGIGGFKKMSLSYSESQDEWNGTIQLDLGELFFVIDLEMSVRASDGVPTYIRAAVDDLNIPIGNSGVFLQSVRAAFGLEPLVLAAGMGITAGPQIAGAALIRGDGDFEIALEPHFRLDASATIRILPAGDGELARGTGRVILDSNGYLSISGDARFEVALFGVGIAADIGGSGAYATEHNQFNIEAHATGQLLLGFLGDFNVVQAKAVVSSDGWGTCAKLNFLLTAGVGQQWHDNVKLFTNCDLSPYKAVVHARSAQNGVRSQTLTVQAGTKELGIEVSADAADPQVRLVDPAGNTVVTSVPQGNRTIGRKAVVVAQPGQSQLYFGVARPAAGTWRVQWAATGPQVTGVRTARDAPPLTAQVSVTRKHGDRPGRRRIKIERIAGLGAGEQVMIGVRTPTGVVPLGVAGKGGLRKAFDELAAGNRQIVATVIRDGIPLAGRTQILKRYTEALSGPPRTIERKRKRDQLTLKAIARDGVEAPDAWHYSVRSKAGVFASVRAKNGKPVTITLPNYQEKIRVTARPVLHGRVLDSVSSSAPVA